ncbi:MAG: response regulator [Anaerolineae bacterium]|nr:response regulator [Anaerolineae bacterium]
MDVRSWLQKNEQTIQKHWFKGIQRLTLPHYADLPAEELYTEIMPFYRHLTAAIEQEAPHRLKQLKDWVLGQRLEHGCSLTELLRISFQLRTALGLALLESSDAWRAMATWQKLFPYFDEAAMVLAEFYTQDIEDNLLERLGEAEMLTASLAQATAEADRALLQAQTVYEISRDLNAALEVEQIARILAERLMAVVEGEECAIFLSDEEGELTPAPAAQVTTPAQGGTSAAVQNAVAQAFADKNTHLLRANSSGEWLVVPLVLEDRSRGVVALGKAPGQPFNRLQIDMVESIVRQAAVSLENARLFAEVRALNQSLEERIAQRTQELAEEKERLESLYTITRELSFSLDLNKVLENTLRNVTRAVGAAHGSIMLLDPISERLVYRARMGGREPLPKEGEITPFKPGVGLAGWVIQHRQAVLVDDVEKDERWLPSVGRGTQTRSLIAAPLIVGEDVHGVLIVSDGRPGFFDEEQLRLVTTAAGQVAQAIHNAQLYQYVRETADRLGEMLRTQQEESSKSRAILESIADGVIVTDTHRRIVLINSAAEDILKARGETVMGRDVYNVFGAFSGQGKAEALAAMEALLTDPEPSVAASRVVDTTLELEERVISARLTPVFTENEEFLGVVTVLRDITREVEADRAKSEFVSTVSHELRTPLTSIKGYTDLLIAEAVGPVNDGQHRFLSIIKSNADRLTALINDLLDISRIETGRITLHMEKLRMEDIVLEVANSMRQQIEAKGLKLELDIAPDLEEVSGDRARLIQVLTNLVANAYHYTPEGQITVALSSMDGAVRVDVRDTGIGIAPEEQVKIFERFYRADHPVVQQSEGTGLGLSIVRMFVELHGGRVWVNSELGKGSTFTFILPTVGRELALPTLPPPKSRGKKILVVDDERDILELLRYQLEAQGYEVVATSMGSSVVPTACREKPDLITLDVLLPDKDGFEVLRDLKANPQTAHIPVIILSVVQDAESGLQLGAVDYLAKPIHEERLLSAVERVLARKGKVLIAEDDVDTNNLLSELLLRKGFETVRAFNGYETLAAAYRERPDLILLDLLMPGMDGYEALNRLKRDQATKDIPIIAISAHAADVELERQRLQALGVREFLSKPFSFELLLSEIERTLEDQQGLGA